MSDIQKGVTFHTGDEVTNSSLNNLVDDAIILPGFISSKPVGSPAQGDKFVFFKSANQSLAAVTLNGLISAFPRGGAANAFALRKLGTQAGTAAAGDDSRFPADFIHGGIRKANHNQPDTVATPQDLCFAAKHLSGGSQIDWSLGELFYDSITANKTYTFANVPTNVAQVITVALQLNGHTVTFPSLLGVAPQINASATVHYFTFIKTPLGVSGTVVAL
jgi:hypothetical protein